MNAVAESWGYFGKRGVIYNEIIRLISEDR